MVRLCSLTPRSAYSLELLRLLCQHVSFLIGGTDGTLPRDASFEPLYLNNWFSQIMMKIQEQPLTEQLVILVDDLHRLHPLECDIVAALSWLPLNLPPGVHFIASSSVSADALRLTPLQKERLRKNDVLVDLPESKYDVSKKAEAALDFLEKVVGLKAAQRLSSFLACIEYGLSETEILELIMPTGGDEPLDLDNAEFHFASWCLAKHNLLEWLRVSNLNAKIILQIYL